MTTHPTRSRARRAVAVLSALALATIGAAGLVAPASAAPIDGVGNIDPARAATSSLVITKYAKSSTNGITAGNGTQQPDLGTELAGVTFTVQEVLSGGNPLALTTDTGWTQVQAVQSAWSASAPTTLPAGYTLSAVNGANTVTTAANGVATYTPGHFGLFLVRETTPLAAGITDPAQPFLVVLPFPTATSIPANTNEWLYTVYVYPKNSVVGIDKVVNTTDSSFLTRGDFVSWTITNDVPRLASGSTLTTFTVTDTVTDNQLDFVPTANVPAGISSWSVVVQDSTGAAVSMTAGTDYNITPAAATISASTTTVSAVFTPDGLTRLTNLAQGGKVIFTVPTKVVAVPVGGTITNTGDLYVNNAHLTDPASTDFGGLRVFKYATTSGTAPASTQTPLAGAQFSLYVDVDQDGVADPGEVAAANQVFVNGVGSWTSNASGVLNIDALKVGRYLVVETAAPAGYLLDSTPHPVQVVAGPTDGSTVNYLAVSNSQVPPWLLPFTGGDGVMTFTIAGAALMALALGFALVVLRRRKQADEA